MRTNPNRRPIGFPIKHRNPAHHAALCSAEADYHAAPRVLPGPVPLSFSPPAFRRDGHLRSALVGEGGRGVRAVAHTGVLSAEASSAICVQRFDDSRNSAIHTTYRISLRSSSLREPRYPLLRVVSVCVDTTTTSASTGGTGLRALSFRPLIAM
jgi:hypothetical protein